MWIAPTETVMFRGPLGVERVYERFIEDQGLWVKLAIARRDSLYGGACCRLDVIVAVQSVHPETELKLNGGKVHLRLGTDPVQLVSPYRHGGERWSYPWQGADITLQFDLKRFDPALRDTSPMLVRLDSLLTCDKQLVDLGQIELRGLAADTADYAY